MIDLGSPAMQVEKVTFYPGVERDVWYILPSRPKLRRSPDGGANFSLVKYRQAADGGAGAMLRLSAELFESGASLDEVTSQMRRMRGGNIRIAPLPVDRARCDLLLWPGETSRVISISGFPASTQPFEVTIDVGLTPEAANSCQAALESAQAPGALVYWLSCPARRPAMGARVAMDGRRIVQAVTERAGAAPLEYRQIAEALPALQEHGLIRIELSSDAVPAAQLNETIERLVLTNVFQAHGPGIGAAFESRATLTPERLGRETLRFVPKPDGGGRLAFDLTAAEQIQITLARAATITELLEPFGSTAASLVRETEHAPA